MKDELHDATAHRSARTPSVRPPGALPGKDPIALIIEDDPKFSDLLAVHLRQAGYRPLQQYRGRDAVAASRALRPALITLDILLPDLDGWSVLGEIRSAPLMQQVPVLIISVLEAAELGPDCGPTVFLRKPTPRAELIQVIERLAPASDGPTRVLLAEMIGFLLPPSQFKLQAVASAQQAAAALNADLPDVVLLDLIMPRVNGFEFLQTLRADPRTRHLPVLVLTAKHLSPQEQVDLSQAAQAVITKAGFTPQRFIEKLRYLEQVNPLIHSSADADDRHLAQPDELDLSQFRDDFISEAHECLSAVRECYEKESGLSDAAAVERAARAAHTLKGAAGMMGYSSLGDLASQAERLLIGVRDGKVPVDAPRLAELRELHQFMERLVASL